MKSLFSWDFQKFNYDHAAVKSVTATKSLIIDKRKKIACGTDGWSLYPVCILGHTGKWDR